MNRQTVFAIALAAGIAAGLMSLAGLRASAIALPLLIAAPLPVYVASLGWGTTAGIIAAVSATATGLLWYGPAVAAVIAGLLFFPAAFAGHLANLAQPAAQGQGLVWYPIAGILLRLMASVGAGFVIAGLALGYQPNDITNAFVELFKQISTTQPGTTITDEELLKSAHTYAAMIPAMIPAMWLMAHVLVMHVAAVITARSGLLARPPEDIAANMRLPTAALAVPMLGLAGMALLPSPLYEIAAIATGVGFAAFALSGIAELHVVSRGRPARGILLFFAWLTLVVFGFPVFIFAIMGMARSLRAAPAGTPPGASGPGGIVKRN